MTTSFRREQDTSASLGAERDSCKNRETTVHSDVVVVVAAVIQ